MCANEHEFLNCFSNMLLQISEYPVEETYDLFFVKIGREIKYLMK